MHHRIVSYALLVATTAAVLLVMIIQPREATLRKKKLKDMRQFLVAQTCGPGGMYGGCAPSPLSPSGGGSSPAGSSGATSSGNENGISDEEKKRITTECLEHLSSSGYAEVLRQYGWFTNIFNSAVNACKDAYRATQERHGSSALSLVYALLVKNTSPIGMLYQALEKTPAPKKGQSTGDYIDVSKEGAAKYLGCVETTMHYFFTITSVIAKYLTDPLPYITIKDAAEHNKQDPLKVTSVEEELVACLPAEPKLEEVAVIVEPAVKKTEPAPQAKAAPQPVEPEAPSLRELAQMVLIKIKALFNSKSIREMPPLHQAVSQKLGREKQRLEKTHLEISEFKKENH